MHMKWNGLVAFYGTADLEATHQFYAGLLGLPLYKDQGLCRIYRVPGGGFLGFCGHMPVVLGERGPIITLLCDNVDEVYQHLIGTGTSPLNPPGEHPRFKIYHFFVQDPTGYLVEIQKFLD